jgi:hypothetical protein
MTGTIVGIIAVGNTGAVVAAAAVEGSFVRPLSPPPSIG